MNLWWGQTSIQSEELFTNIATGVDNHLHLWSSQKRVDMKNAILQNIKNIFVSEICLGVHNPCCIETTYKSLLDGDVIVTKITKASTFITKYLGTGLSALHNQEITTGRNMLSPGDQRSWKRYESLLSFYPWKHLSQRLQPKTKAFYSTEIIVLRSKAQFDKPGIKPILEAARKTCFWNPRDNWKHACLET